MEFKNALTHGVLVDIICICLSNLPLETALFNLSFHSWHVLMPIILKLYCTSIMEHTSREFLCVTHLCIHFNPDPNKAICDCLHKILTILHKSKSWEIADWNVFFIFKEKSRLTIVCCVAKYSQCGCETDQCTCIF